MLQVLKAIEFIYRIEIGGSTYPWVVNVINSEGKQAPYIVKLFTKRQVLQQNAVAKEVMGNVLAQQFDLYVPACDFIEFDDAFVRTLPPDRTEELAQKDNRVKFGSLQASDMVIWNYVTPAALKPYEIGSVFAFDYLIWNVDRGHRRKPNLLVKDEDFLLIDHELILYFIDAPATNNKTQIDRILNGDICYPYHKHIFYPYLKNLQKRHKIDIFNTFFEYLHRFNVNVLDAYVNQLESLGHPIGNYRMIKSYFSEMKRNSESFRNILYQAIS